MYSGVEYTEARIKDAGVKLLTDKQKEELKIRREEFLKIKGELEEKISNHKLEINQLQIKIESIEIPSIPNAKYIHDQSRFGQPCGLRTAIFYGGDSNQVEDEYYCLFCDALFYAESYTSKK